MFNSIFAKSFLERYKSTFIIALCLGLFSLMFAALFKTVALQLGDYMDSFPKSMQAFVGEFSAATSPAGWLSIELFSLFLPFAVSISAIVFGANAIGKEEESGTLELLLASPVSRGNLITQKALAVAMQGAVITGTTWAGVALGTLMFEFDVSLVNVFWASVSAWLLGLVFGYFALAAQSLKGSRSFGLGVGASLLAFGYFADVTSKLVESLHSLRYFSPFHYFDIQNVLTNGANAGMFVLAGLVLSFYLVAHFTFASRDTNV